ncbi:MAG: cupin domain-containing protein [Lewinellaceae bacterium]|nr:cupin domain-containing protein [Lewinellaceae bacterium]
MQLKSAATLKQLSGHEGSTFLELFRHGTMSVELYKPEGLDLQQPHEQDDIYIVLHGHGQFLHGSTQVSFGPGDLLFVPAGIEHRFLDFSDDFCTWVIFYGPKGGEKGLF